MDNLQPLLAESFKWDELSEKVSVALRAGQLMLAHGAETERVEEIVLRIANGLGCERINVLIMPKTILATIVTGGEFRTKMRQVVHRGVNMTKIAEIYKLSIEISKGDIGVKDAAAKLEVIAKLSREYKKTSFIIAIGLSCAAFSRIFGGDLAVFFIVWIAASAAMYVRVKLTERQLNPLLVISATSFVGVFLASFVGLLHLSKEPAIALASVVLFLIPGVPLINAFEDLIKGHTINGFARGLSGLLISFAIAIGLMIAIRITGVGL